ncbi:hypothetical protein L218DRAFT_1065786 [Marasmius fiardii PR-910]|nr:hypothetical protein L218DRAFT_1065786 [Marasmius fiardii PR-910]
MNSSVHNFHISNIRNDLSSDILKEYWTAVSDHMPTLRILRVDAPKNSQDVLKGSLKASLDGLSSLESLTLPSFTDLSYILTLISSCSDSTLKTLQFTRGLKDVGVEQMMPLSRTNALPNLTELSLHTPYELLAHFLRETRNFAPRLTSLRISSTSTRRESPSAVKDLFEVISQQFSHIQRLSLVFDPKHPPPPGQEGSTPPNLAEAVHFVHIEPILSCSSMSSFEITHPLPLVIREADMVKLASSWSRLTSLRLCDDPQVRSLLGENSTETVEPERRLDLCALLPLGRFCPLLEELKVSLVPVVGESESSGSRSSSTDSSKEDNSPQAFKHLVRFSPGYCPLLKEGKVDTIGVAMFLSRVLPASCEIGFETCWDRKVLEEGWNGIWDPVRKGLAYVEEIEKRGKGGSGRWGRVRASVDSVKN